MRKQGCENSWLFFEAKWDPRAKKFGKHLTKAKEPMNRLTTILLNSSKINNGREFEMD
jgi:hypothetical protein